MRISSNIARLRRMAPRAGPMGAVADRLSALGPLADNPGNLRARVCVPAGIVKAAPLVVVLHGCTQNAAAYDQGSGWSRLADRCGFALLFPEQRRENNPNLCFNWFEPSDARRDQGEPASIRAMVARMIEKHDLDAARVFVTGLSAGGAMASIMLATYPEVFAGGAIIAGIPYGCAAGLGGAFECMAGGGRESARELGDKVRRASPHEGPWPRVSVWHGSADPTVAASNGDDVVKQWLNLHALPAAPQLAQSVAGYPHRAWLGADGRPLVEQYVITGMGHGTPLAPGEGAGQSGQAGAHMLDAAISSTDRIAAFWGISEEAVVLEPQPAAPARAPVKRVSRQAERKVPAQTGGVQAVIESALKAAGLLR